MLSILMALLLVFLVWEFAGDIRGGNAEEDREESEAQESDGAEERPRIELLPVYTVSNEMSIEEDADSSQDSQAQLSETVEDALPIIEDTQTQEDATSTAQILREGIALVMPDEDETGEMGVRYDRSFTAKLIQSDDEVKEWYSEIKNYLFVFQKSPRKNELGKRVFRIGKGLFC